MAKNHSQVAYPFTKSDRHRDKIMSEVQLANLHRALVSNNDYVVISWNNGVINSFPTEILLRGYYFKLDPDFSSQASAFYIYVQGDKYFVNDGKEFPELMQVVADPNSVYADHECIFDHKLTDDELNLIGIQKDGDDLYIQDGNTKIPVSEIGGNYRDDSSGNPIVFVDLGSLFSVYYFGETYDDTKIGKIWIRTRTKNGIIEAINPYVYNDGAQQGQFGFGKWVPLGAVYKDFQN